MPGPTPEEGYGSSHSCMCLQHLQLMNQHKALSNLSLKRKLLDRLLAPAHSWGLPKKKQFEESAQWCMDHLCRLRAMVSSELRAALEIFCSYSLWLVLILVKDNQWFYSAGEHVQGLFRGLLHFEEVKQKRIVCCTIFWYPVLLHSHHTEENIQ